MAQQPVVVRIEDLAWESWDDGDTARRGNIVWKALFTGERTPTGEMTAGLARVPPGGSLERHRHAHAEMYVILAGAGLVEIAGERHAVRPGMALFIPGNALHGIANPGDADLELLYTFAADSFAEVVYHFE